MPSERLQRQIDRLLDEAAAAAEAKDWAASANAARRVLAVDADNAEATSFIHMAEATTEATATDATPASEGISRPATPTPPDVPESFAEGRYAVQRLIGEGGKKRVYLARDTVLDREVAVALIKTEGLDDVGRERVMREAQAMGRLGAHPHVVTVFDIGAHEDQPYIVIELLGGGDVEGLIEDAPDHRVPLERTLEIVLDVCRGLEFIHAKRLIHRDLKPGNVMLTDDGVAKVADYGLALARDRARLTVEGVMVGTVGYMPPEQAVGGEITERADLYSLGAMLYEMVTGRTPFLGDDPVAIISQHVNTPPVEPTWHNAACPEPLSALIMRLLSKDAADRPASAREVATALQAIDPTTPIEADTDGAPTLDRLAGGVFVGRQREMDQLKAALEGALGGRGRVMMLVGEPGIGKTRTAEELATYARMRDAQVLWGHCYEAQGVPPYWPWVQAIRLHVRDRDPDALRSEMGSGAADIAEIVSEVRERLPNLGKPPRLNPAAARFRLFDAVATFLKTASQAQPLVVVLDDLHWADEPSLRLLEHVARELDDGRLLIIGTYRHEELNRRHPLARTLGELTRERLFERVLLRGLDRADVGRFIELVAGLEPPQSLVQAVYTQTEGNPLFVQEVVRLLVQEGELQPQRAMERESWEIRIPEGVVEVIGRRLDRVAERTNEVLTIAAIVGREFTLDQLRAVDRDLPEASLLDVLDEALDAKIIEELPREVGRYQFAHSLMRETLMNELSATRIVRMHAQIAETLEGLYGDTAPSRAAELAYHFAQAETVLGADKLVRYAQLAGAQALDRYAWEEARSQYERALAARGETPVDGELADIWLGLARALEGSSNAPEDVERAADYVTRAFDYFEASGNETRAVEAALEVGDALKRPREVSDRLTRALAMVPDGSRAAAQLLGYLGVVLAQIPGEDTRAHEATRRGRKIAGQLGDTRLEAEMLWDAAVAAGAIVGGQLGYDLAREAIGLAEAAGDAVLAARARVLAAWHGVSLGRAEDSQSEIKRALPALQRIRDRVRVDNAHHVLAMAGRALGQWSAVREQVDASPESIFIQCHRTQVDYELGEFEDGQAHREQMLDLARARAERQELRDHYPPTTIAVTGRIAGSTEHFEDAERWARELLDTPPEKRPSYLALGLLAVQRGDVESAAKSYEEIRNVDSFAYWSVSWERALGLLAQITGRSEQARDHFEQALTFTRESSYRPELAWTCADYASMLLDSGGADDRDRALQLQDEALAITRDLGMRPLTERILARRELLKA